jgi:hypothetical protein
MGYCHPTDKIMITKTNNYSKNDQSFIADRKPDKPIPSSRTPTTPCYTVKDAPKGVPWTYGVKQSHDYESVRNRIMVHWTPEGEANAPIVDAKKNAPPKAKLK